MGMPVIHFEIIGRDEGKLQDYYSQLFGWETDADNPLNYGVVERAGNTAADGSGIGDGVGQAPDGGAGQVTFYVDVPNVEAALAKAESLGGTRLFGPAEIPGNGRRARAVRERRRTHYRTDEVTFLTA
jgi:predicted enzyme related to lactoylglutathione lyase